MHWLIGVDEAGYGPNLGPLVMSVAAVGVASPPAPMSGTLWHHLRAGVRRAGEAEGRLLIDDSKKVYSGSRGLLALETGVLATAYTLNTGLPTTLGEHVARLASSSRADLDDDPCYAGTTAIPTQTTPARWAIAADAFCRSCGVSVAVQSLAIPATRFNELIADGSSKAVTIGSGLVRLLRWCDETLPTGDPFTVAVDKQGGRNFYGPLIREAFPSATLQVEEESAERSRYTLVGAGRPVSLLFVPRADGEHLPVALASMASKYLRELLMMEFNAFWLRHLPTLKPTAGYPQDARRFMEEIRPTLTRLGLDVRRVWRMK